jgi:hypothetical protein
MSVLFSFIWVGCRPCCLLVFERYEAVQLCVAPKAGKCQQYPKGIKMVYSISAVAALVVTRWLRVNEDEGVA